MKHTWLWVTAGIACAAGAVICSVQLIMAVRYGELGRVLVYFTIGALCLEAAAASVLHVFREFRKDKTE